MRNGERKMVHHNGYVAGWLDSSIHDFLAHFSRTFKSVNFALITSLDSDLSPSSLLGKSPHLNSLANVARLLKTGILLPTAALVEADVVNRIFLGFDEVWFFPTDKIEPKPQSACLVGPNRIDQTKLDKLASWVTENGCSLALGDGCGLNFIMKAHGLVKYLLAYSMSQPQPTAGGKFEK